jgi:glycerol-3-phosphate acyltransferase PlsX
MQAIRRAKTTSMGRAIAAVKAKEADALVSGGNTGALMAMSKLALRTLPGIDRPALAGLMPTLGDNDTVMLDLGANTESNTDNLVQFALMGAAYARVVLDLDKPRVRLLNIGSEEQKGTDELKDASAVLKAAAEKLGLRFDGYIEGHQMSRGDVDVIVSDGFSGNIALKTMEGTARYIGDLIRRAFANSIRSKIGFAISRPATQLLRHHLDPNNHNGGVFLGLNGLVVKSHGGANDIGIANAIQVAERMAREDLTRRITEDLAQVSADDLGKVAAQ